MKSGTGAAVVFMAWASGERERGSRDGNFRSFALGVSTD
jgi:hypothetical protein